MYILLFVAGVAVLGGSVFLFTRLDAWEQAAPSTKVAQLRAQRSQIKAERDRLRAGVGMGIMEQLQAQPSAQLEEKRIQLRAEWAEVRTRDAKAEAQLRATREEKTKAEAQLEARLAAVEKREQRLAVDQRRFEAWKKCAAAEAVKWEAYAAEIKAQYGVRSSGELPEAEQDKVCDDLLRRLAAIDPPLFRNMFSNPFGFIEAPKPIKQPDNPLQRLLEKGVEAGILDAKELEDEEVRCCISFAVMQDPVKGEDGRFYDRFCLENIYYAQFGYPFNRQEITRAPAELPRDEACYAKIQSLMERCQAAQSRLVEVEEEDTRSSFGLV